MASFRRRGKVWYFAFVDGEGRRIERPGCSDKRATEGLAAAAEAEAARVREGLSDAKSESRRRHALRTLADHLDDFHAHLSAKGATAKHANLFTDRARRV